MWLCEIHMWLCVELQMRLCVELQMQLCVELQMLSSGPESAGHPEAHDAAAAEGGRGEEPGS